MSIKVSFEKIYEKDALKFRIVKSADSDNAILVMESGDGKIEMDRQAAFDLSELFKSAANDMQREKK